jgi:soluble lytic murein transglycosylase
MAERAHTAKRLYASLCAIRAGAGIIAIALPALAAPAVANDVPLPRPRPAAFGQAGIAQRPPVVAPSAAAAESALSAADLAAVKQAIEFLHAHNAGAASETENQITDPVARKLVEWAILRDDDSAIEFARYSRFINENPGWASLTLFRRRAEAMLWQSPAGPAVVRAFFASTKPLTAKGRFALARALLSEGDRITARNYVREAWHLDGFSHELESQARELFGDLITAADDKARMESRLYANDNDGALRAAEHLDAPDFAIAQAWAAINAKSNTAEALLEAVPPNVRNDVGYLFAYAQWLRRNDKIAEAGQLMLAASRDPERLRDVDEWWIERRLVARKLLDIGDARTAYLVVRDAAPPSKENYRIEQQFTAGWIALRFLDDPATAIAHFSRISQMSENPIALARAGYWMGRAIEASGKPREARPYYEEAARHTTAYYGQLARARLGLPELPLSAPPALSGERRTALSRLEIVRAVEILYAIDARDLVAPMVADLADRVQDPAPLIMLGEICRKYQDARAVNLIGKAALARGFAFDYYAFPTIGVPTYRAVGPDVERALVFAIVKQESAFNPKDVSSARALGLMQVTPEAGRFVAKKFKVKFDERRLLSDVTYNLQMGSAELGGVIGDYRGSYVLAFAAYNAGSGRVREWLDRYGDPRDPRVDPIDWVERIPFAETRNYVQRVLENLQVYRVRFSTSPRLMIEADLHRGTVTN